LDSSACAVVLYGLGTTTLLVLGAVERYRRSSDSRVWPAFWFATSGLLLIMALGRASDVGDLLTEIGREQARSNGWYELRRSLQAWVIGAVTAVWAVTIGFAGWRVPERRRYLPTAVVVFTLVCFTGVRIISLHQVDALLHNRDVRGVTVGAAIEVGLLLLLIAVSAWRHPRSNRR
jgi:hypothetical protein